MTGGVRRDRRLPTPPNAAPLSSLFETRAELQSSSSTFCPEDFFCSTEAEKEASGTPPTGRSSVKDGTQTSTFCPAGGWISIGSGSLTW